MATRTGNSNARKKLPDLPAAPWMAWPEPARSPERAIRWIETYCRLPKGYGAGENIRLAPFQKAWFHAVLTDGVSSAAMSIARGNGKSTLLATLALWAVFDPDPMVGSPQVPVVATTVGQVTKTVYGPALEMVRANPELADRSLIYSAIGASKLMVPSTGGEMFPISNDVDGLQGLDPSLAICDEIGFQPIDSWNSLLLSGIKRPRSLVVGIGTPGLDKDNALWHLRSVVREGGDIPGFVFTEYAADEGCSLEDESQWDQANPARAAGYQRLDAMATNRKLTPEGSFRIFHLGQWVDGVDCWLGNDGRNVWDALRDPYTLVRGDPTWVGVDAAIKKDTTAVVAVQRRPDGRLHASCRIWVPSPGSPLDMTDVMQHLRELNVAYKLQEVAFDPRFFDVPAKMLDDEHLPMVEVPQSPEMMTKLVGTTYELIMRGQLSHDDDDAFATQVLNAVPRFSENGFTLQKTKSRGKIDAAVAMAMAVGRTVRDVPKRVRVVSLAAAMQAMENS